MRYLSEISITDFRLAVEAYGDDVWNYAYVLTRDRHLADGAAAAREIPGNYNGESSQCTRAFQYEEQQIPDQLLFSIQWTP
ncbi:hypothetical protein [Paenibacillus methanolicus]|nr:hypothetical protein [Paenibacillus methanolicus]